MYLLFSTSNLLLKLLQSGVYPSYLYHTASKTLYPSGFFFFLLYWTSSAFFTSHFSSTFMLTSLQTLSCNLFPSLSLFTPLIIFRCMIVCLLITHKSYLQFRIFSQTSSVDTFYLISKLEYAVNLSLFTRLNLKLPIVASNQLYPQPS